MAWVFSLILHNMERRIRKLIRVSAITVGALLLTGFVVVAFVINFWIVDFKCMLYHYLKYARNTFEMISSSFLHVFNRYQQGDVN